MMCEDCNTEQATYLIYDREKDKFFFVGVNCINPVKDKAISYEEIKEKFESE